MLETPKLLEGAKQRRDLTLTTQTSTQSSILACQPPLQSRTSPLIQVRVLSSLANPRMNRCRYNEFGSLQHSRPKTRHRKTHVLSGCARSDKLHAQVASDYQSCHFSAILPDPEVTCAYVSTTQISDDVG